MTNVKHHTLPPVPELLAPAGSPACALAAFDAGADAIYAGLAKFNARERGENFTPEVMAQIVDYAHKLGRKVYIAGLKIAKELGVTRVVLERQMTIEEIAEVKKSTDLELEVFIHGALCASLSGQCLFSSYLGGYSGNRGKCKQPCRRRYFSKNGNGFFFSPQDLCSIDMLPRLREIGVASLKIEGRLKQPDYVKQTVGAYRMLLDAPPRSSQNGSAKRAICSAKGADASGRSDFSARIRPAA